MDEPEGARGRAASWPQDRARVRQLARWPPWRLHDLAIGLGERLRAWLAAEAGAGRLVPWLPVAFGFGAVLYFTADREPALWAGAVLCAGCGAAVILLRRQAAVFAAAALAFSASLGFAAATWKSERIAHSVLPRALFNVELAGWVETREERERTDRIVIAVHEMKAARLATPLQRVRVSVRKGTAPPVGSFVELRARLSPPLAPLRPGGYDFARDLFFQKIGASGFALGAIRIAEPPVQPGLWLRYAAVMQGMRDAIDTRIRAVLPGDKGSIASALITGKRDAISAHVNDAMYVSGIGHVLSISGYHMVVVFGVVFFALRAS
ncbi:MAG TPA: ComEC/Rec2 family competence protein, partial [Xanthobacteraceae bacterium]